VPVASLVRKPDSLTHEEAASLGVTFLTAWIGVMEYARLSKGETLAVIGLGGVGHAAMELAKFHGANAIGLDRNALADPATLKNVRADVVLDTVGGPMIETAIQLAAHRGRVVEISGGSERRVSFDIIDFYRNERQLFGVDSLKRDLLAASATLRHLAPAFQAGALTAGRVGAVLPLEQAGDGYRLASEGKSGRVVLKG
jgi:NADPH:quinone reductase-like Zn-dependent oxidoreductase